MDCRKAEMMVDKYIERTLSIREMEAFLDHVEKCSSCYDELETYYIVHEAMAQLDNDGTDAVLDMKNMLRQDIWNSRTYIQKVKAIKILAIGGGFLTGSAVVALIVYGLLEVFRII